MTFEDLKIIEPVCRALAEEGYTNPTPIQEKSIPSALTGTDILGLAETGTGKTAAFTIPVLQTLYNRRKAGEGYQGIQALILAPTRELAIQIGESINTYGRHTSLKYAVIFGGVPQRNQERVLKNKIDIVVATPGRLLDLADQRIVKLHNINMLILDEADRMLSMGFIDDVRRIVKKLPSRRQNFFYSATMPDEIQRLADEILKNPFRAETGQLSAPNRNIEQEVYQVDKINKHDLLVHLLQDETLSKVLVFSKTKHTANKVSDELNRKSIQSAAIHGNKTQAARRKALESFKKGKLRVLVATDIASRGIDIDEVTHVINYELPNEAEAYIHRIGRTGRAGLSGKAISFCAREEKTFLRSIEKLSRQQIQVNLNHPYNYGTASTKPKENGHSASSNSNGYNSYREQDSRRGGQKFKPRSRNQQRHR
ncbi:MAG TPA: DEAD/DEAH box helicase [Leptospiraceae bacterium]|nr:DEAD/DEAH box helicase [Leptospiraceae bacterium]HMY65684.1 DEAD/DEAH box helicase [Leptospiraceae bacterium]HMZ57745.1 DEAD/DEAH box helicase [Leptospiraceae bacterium]HNF14072.1 DEAD/DEAH box helicase [Leptospiraceae bacterium]HNF25737.1 DEAD/DEAH box helicase [Leptospiraceae bacterium]